MKHRLSLFLPASLRVALALIGAGLLIGCDCLARPVIVRGRILHSTGAGSADIGVTLYEPRGGDPPRLAEGTIPPKGAPARRWATVRTDADGRFEHRFAEIWMPGCGRIGPLLLVRAGDGPIYLIDCQRRSVLQNMRGRWQAVPDDSRFPFKATIATSNFEEELTRRGQEAYLVEITIGK